VILTVIGRIVYVLCTIIIVYVLLEYLYQKLVYTCAHYIGVPYGHHVILHVSVCMYTNVDVVCGVHTFVCFQ